MEILQGVLKPNRKVAYELAIEGSREPRSLASLCISA
jgi:hypothetical protein